MEHPAMTVGDADPAGSGAAGARARASAWRNPWVIAWIGLIVVVLGVNITMVVLAIATNPGLIRDDYYESGRDVERTIQTRLAEGPQWTIRVDIPADIRAEAAAKVRFAAVDAVGQPVAAEEVTYFAYRPSDAARDFSLPMAQIGPGLFEAEVTFPLGGVWDTVVAVQQGDEEHAFGQRISVGQP
jgi:nitrogen fixation protein FixH